MTLYFIVKYLHVLGAIIIGALVKTGPAIVLMLVALLTLDSR